MLPTFHANLKEGVQGEEVVGDEREGGQKGIRTPGADVFIHLFSVRDVGYEGHKNLDGRWYWVPIRKKTRGDLWSVLSSHNINYESYSRMDGVEIRKSCWGKGDLHLPSVFAG